MVQLKWFGHYGPIACILWYERMGQICHCVHCQHHKSELVEMLPVDRFQSRQCIIIHHTHNESLEWSSSSGWGVMVQLLAYFGMKGWDRYATLSTANTAKVGWWRCFQWMDSNLDSASSFIIPIMSHWNGPAQVVGALWSNCLHTLV